MKQSVLALLLALLLACLLPAAATADSDNLLSLSQTEALLFVGRSLTLRPTQSAGREKVSWESDNPDVATVNTSGRVRARAEGTATITASVPSGSRAQCVVRVEIPARSVELSQTRLNLYLGHEGIRLTASVLPENTTDHTITWTSSRPEVASVDENGQVTPLSLGSTRITARTKSGALRTATVYVRRPAQSVSLSQSQLTVYAGKTARLSASVSPKNAYDRQVAWASSDEQIATVSRSGVITGRAEGTAWITATTESGARAQCEVRVEIAVKKVALSAPETRLFVGGDPLALAWQITPQNATNPALAFTSSRPAVASVDESGRVYPLSVGTTRITAVASSGVKTSVTLRVVQPPLSVSLNRDTLSVTYGRTARLSAEVLPKNAYTRAVTWVSSDPSVATVSRSGVVSGKRVGSCQIIARDAAGHSAVCQIHVGIPATAIRLDTRQVTLVRGGSGFRPTATLSPANTTMTALTAVSSDPSVATVSADGLIAPVSSGECDVTFSTENGKTASLRVRVVDPATSISLPESEVRMTCGQSLQMTATVLPETAGDRTVEWSVTDKRVAAVDEQGVLYAKSEGVCTLVARARGGLDLVARCTVRVTGTPDKVVALTFDGTVPENAMALLDVLNTYGVKATFFITTDELAGREDRVLRLYESGMEIANHTQNHPHFDRISTEAALREIAECDRALEAITGQRPALIRAPFGTLPARVALQEDRWFVHWSLDTIDWKFINTRYIYNRIVGEVKDKDIILMHQSLPETTEAVRRAIPVLIERGYRFVTCSELIELCDGVSTQAKVHRFVAN